MKRLLLILALLYACSGMAQTDTAFWFAAPDLSSEFGETPIRLVFHTYDQPATITVEQPTNNSFPTATFAIPANGVQTLDLSPWVDIIETKPVNTVLNRGFYIHSTAPITCYYQSTSSNRETYTLKGRNALGTEFCIVPRSSTGPYSHHPPRTYQIGTSLEIIATEDNTHIRIFPEINHWYPQLLVGYTADDTLVEVDLNRGQSYAVRGEYAATTLTLYRIIASRPIAVNVTSDACASIHQLNANVIEDLFNVVAEQIIPLSHWGNEYVAIANNNGWVWGDFHFVSAESDSNYFSYNGNSERNYIGNEWSSYLVPNLFDSTAYIKARLPFCVFHNINDSHHLAGTILPYLKCSGSNQIAYLRCGDSLSLEINMIVETQAISDLRFNGESTILTATDFRPLPGDSAYSWCIKNVDQFVGADSVMRISCSSSRFILGVIESGLYRGTSYTYLTDYAPYTSIEFDMDTIYCAGSPIQFRAYNIDSVTVYGPNGLVLTEPPYIIPDADTTMSGTYLVQGFSTESCHDLLTDSIHLHIFIPNQTDIYDTIVENQLPWQCPDATIYAQIDTDFHHPDTLLPCDSIIHYHLHVHHNIHDTLLYYACESDLPVQFEDTLFYQEGQGLFRHTGSHGEDSIVIFILHIIPSSDTTIRDSIAEDQLPWFFLDTVFNDTVADYIFHTFNEAGCDSIIHYNLFIFWNGDHCDTALSYPNVVTPNGDGTNDCFVIGGLIEHTCFKYNELTIYDRYGHCVYHKRNIATEDDWWDPAAQRTPAGTYFYYFKAHGVNIWTQHRGVIEVLRDK